MSPIRLLTIMTAAALFVGCTENRQSDSDGQSVLTAERVAEIRAIYQQVDPNTRLGYVNALLPDSGLASIADVPVEDFRPGDAVSFIDQQQEVIAHGRVVNVVGQNVHVKFEPGTRAPEVGDLAVKFMR